MPLLKSKGGWTTTDVVEENIKSYVAYTLIDVSDTEVTDPDFFDTLEYNQFQNLNTLSQIMGLRTQPIILEVTLEKNVNIKNYNFGSEFSGKQNVWKIKFSSESNDPWKMENDDFYFLKKDINGIAFISGLSETAKFKIDVFDAYSTSNKNIYFKNV